MAHIDDAGKFPAPATSENMAKRIPTRVALLATAVVCGPAQAQDFLDVPYCFTRSPEVFAEMFERARCETVHAILLGDSQETSPGGAGAVYIPRLQYEFWLRYANAPMTPVADMMASDGGGMTPSDWLLRTANTVQGVTESRVPSAMLPPGTRGCKSSTLDGTNINQGQYYPQLVVLQNDCLDTAAAADLRGRMDFFPRSAQVYLDVFAATNPSSGEVNVSVMSSATGGPHFFSPILESYQTNMGLEAPEGEVRVQRIGPLAGVPGNYCFVGLSGTDAQKYTDIVGARFVNASDPRGWSITSFAEGGYKTPDFMARHGQSGAFLRAMTPEVVFICYGANDATNDHTAQQFKANLRDLIAFLRAVTRPDLRVILMSDPLRAMLPESQDQELALQARMHWELAQEDPLVCSLNSRRLTHEAGWTPSRHIYYTTDRVHYSPLGAWVKAELEARTLFDAFLWQPPCPKPNPLWVNCRREYWCERPIAAAVEERQPPPRCNLDFNSDGVIDQFDIVAFGALIAGAENPYELHLDLTEDGVVDQDDFIFAVNAIAGGGGCE